MYTKFEFQNGGTLYTVDFLMDPTPPAYMCLTDCNFEIVGSSTDRDRMEANASWPTFTYYKRLLIHCEVDVLADTPQHFHTFWHNQLQGLMVAPTVLQLTRTQGTLTIRPAGVTEDWEMPVVVDSPPGIPRGGLSPSAGKMTVTFKSFRPYFHRAETDDYVWHV